MVKYLLIVESPSKCKKIESYLKSAFPQHSFKCIASVGHFMTLSKKNGIDIDNNFKPNFIESIDKKKVIKNIKSFGKKYKKENILIATDMDREGEKIAYDLYKLLKIDLDGNNRMVFNEITKKGLINAFNNIKKLDKNQVNAQIARRVLDRLLGFGISGITMKEVQRGASAGRVLSPTTKIIYDREEEIKNSIDNSDYTIYGDFENVNKKYSLNLCNLSLKFNTKDKVLELFKMIQKSTYKIKKIKKTKKISNPPLPFITSTINQVSPFSIKKTTKLLQDLYQKGHITYIRTDSTIISKDALDMISKDIKTKFGDKYLKIRENKKKVKGAQEAHECIRQTKMVPLINDLENDHQKLYTLIYQRTIASQMKEYEYNQNLITIYISKSKHTFQTTIDIPIDFGYKLVYQELIKKMKLKKKQDKKILKSIKKDDILKYIKIYTQEKFHNKYPRYSESKLVKKLEELGIGRPSTYMMAVTKIQDKQYVTKGTSQGESKMVNSIIMTKDSIKDEKVEILANSNYNKMILTPLGEKITEYLDNNFDMLVDYNFTATMEKDLDLVSKGTENWVNVVKKYYTSASKKIETKKKEMKNTPNDDKSKNVTLLGTYEDKEVYTFISKWGPRIVLGEPGSKGAKYITPQPGIILDNINLQNAIEIINNQKPVSIGKYKGNDMFLTKGPYGHYIKCNNKNYSIHYKYKKKEPRELTEEDALDCISKHFEKEEWKKNNPDKLKNYKKKYKKN